MRFELNWCQLCHWGLLGAAGVVHAVDLPPYAQDLFDESMVFQDAIYDPTAAYLHYFYYPLAAGAHETRSSVWYAAGLLQRNRGDDVHEAVRILENVIGVQEKDPSVLWYGDYTKYPEQPTVGSAAYPAVIYNSWDPNWRGFIGTALIVIYEEFRPLLPAHLPSLILDSLYNNTIGDSYRVGGVDNDNLYPAYSNAWLMRTVVTSWTGRQFQDRNMSAAGDASARAFLALFNTTDTLSEFNGPTYAGVSLYALTLAAKYLSPSSPSSTNTSANPSTTTTTTTATPLIGQHAPALIQTIWTTTAQLWHPTLRNLAGPWDRTYGYDMTNYVAIMSLWIWAIVGKTHAYPPSTQPIYTLAHADDFEIAPLLAILAPFHKTLLPDSILTRLTSLPSTLSSNASASYIYKAHTYAPPADLTPRTITTFLSPNLTIGTFSYNQSTIGGFSKDSTSYSPAVIQWLRPRDNSVGYMSLIPSEAALCAEVEPYRVSLSYPDGNASSVFEFAVAVNPLHGVRDVGGLEDVEGVDVRVAGGTVEGVPLVGFCGLLGGVCEPVHGFEVWKFRFSMPAGSVEVPRLVLEFGFGG